MMNICFPHQMGMSVRWHHGLSHDNLKTISLASFASVLWTVNMSSFAPALAIWVSIIIKEDYVLSCTPFYILLVHNGVMVIIAGNGHGDMSSNPGQDWLHFT